MKRNLRSRLLLGLALGLLALAPLSRISAQEKAAVPPAGTVNVTVTAGTAPPPPVSITLLERHGHVTPRRGHCTHTGGGLIEITSPTPDVVIITMSGAVLANSEMTFELDQCFEVSFDNPKVKKAKLSVEGRVIGLLRSHCKGTAEQGQACATVSCGSSTMLNLCVDPHTVAEGENLTVNCHVGPLSGPVAPGKYTLHEVFRIAASSTCCLFKRPSAEFAPDPALDPLWISYFDPFHGINKKDLGFQVVLKVAPDEEKETGQGQNQNQKQRQQNLPEVVPAPKPKS
jgi:hypothetical protein